METNILNKSVSDYVNSLEKVFEKRNRIKGMKMIYEPTYLRFFQARFTKIK